MKLSGIMVTSVEQRTLYVVVRTESRGLRFPCQAHCESPTRISKYADPIEKDGTRIITIGIGKDVNDEFLRKLASSSEDYHFAEASFELKRIYKKVTAGLAERR